MNGSTRRCLGTGLLVITVAAGCASAGAGPAGETPPPDRGAEAGQAPRPAGGSDRQRSGYTEADVRFVQGMIAHHAQALTMTAMVPARSAREDVRTLAQRIEVSQQDEIDAMRRWLRDRGEDDPSAEPHHGHHETAAGRPMHGMLTREELARLEAASGAEFDRLFLELMIRHHEGALEMVDELLSSPGAGQEPQIFQIASEVEADQRMEIERMRRMQSAGAGGTSPL